MKATNEARLRKHWKLSFGLATLVLLCLKTAVAQTAYTVTDVGTLGGTFSIATGVNSHGQVSGHSTLPGDIEDHAFLWQNGVMTDLGTLGGTTSESSSMNQRGQEPGGSDLPGDTAAHAVLWTNGVIADLGTLGGTNSFGSGINSQGHVAGAADTPNSGGNPAICIPNECHAFLWIHGVMTDLGTLPGGANSFAFNVDDLDRPAGLSDITTIPDPILGFPPYHATLWVNGVPTDLGTLGGKLSLSSIGTPVNNRGQVVGCSDLSGDAEFHAFLWQNGAMQDLGTFAGDPDSCAFGTNNRGQVIGVSGTFTETLHVLLWENGVPSDLNTLIPADSDLQLLVPLAIDPLGHIAGVALQKSTGEVHGILLTPATPASATGTPTTPAETSATSKVVIPENVRKLIRWGMPGMGRFKIGMARPK